MCAFLQRPDVTCYVPYITHFPRTVMAPRLQTAAQLAPPLPLRLWLVVDLESDGKSPGDACLRQGCYQFGPLLGQVGHDTPETAPLRLSLTQVAPLSTQIPRLEHLPDMAAPLTRLRNSAGTRTGCPTSMIPRLPRHTSAAKAEAAWPRAPWSPPKW